MEKQRIKLRKKHFRRIQSFIGEDENLTFTQKVILTRLLYQAARHKKIQHFAPAWRGSSVKIEPFGISRDGQICVQIIGVPSEIKMMRESEKSEQFCINLSEAPKEEPEKRKIVGKKLTIL